MREVELQFADATGYESFMGRWSRALAPHILRSMNPRPKARWLDVGCGTGIFTEAVLHSCAPVAVMGIDPAAAQIEQALRTVGDARAGFKQGDATHLPFADASFDYTVAALVINFIPEPLAALAEMRRVTIPGGLVCAFVWDFERELSPSGPLRQAMRAFGVEVPALPGTQHSSLGALQSLFRCAGLPDIEPRTIDIVLGYRDFEDFWSAQTPSYSPTTRIIDAMSERDRRRLKRTVHDALPIGPHGKIEYAARANAVQAKVAA
jgi:SAM-dependent methyltransferase